MKRPVAVVASALILTFQSLAILGSSFSQGWHRSWIPGAASMVSTLVGLAIVALIWNRQRYIRWLLIPLALWGLPDAILRFTTADPVMAPVDSVEGFYLNGYQPISKVVSVLAVALLFTPRAHKWFSGRGECGAA